ncbi:MAG: hypothetical protein OXU83_07405 [Gammaproteobacteria bacterium]|nr:hypothetical protein [Gammaproteobacteria bacterium]
MYQMNFIAGLPVIASLLLMSAARGGEQDAPASVYDDCSRVEIPYEEDGKALTAAEKTARMDKAFYESLARFERCQTSLSSDDGSDAGGGSGSGGSGGGGSGGGGDSGSSGNAGDSGGNNGAVQSVPSSSVSGTEPDSDKKEDGTARETALQSPQTGTDRQPQAMPGSGKLPEDIPPADNDSVLEAQIRAAAQAEQDPEKRERLWNEYRRYKNLPIKKSTMEEKPQ